MNLSQGGQLCNAIMNFFNGLGYLCNWLMDLFFKGFSIIPEWLAQIIGTAFPKSQPFMTFLQTNWFYVGICDFFVIVTGVLTVKLVMRIVQLINPLS